MTDLLAMLLVLALGFAWLAGIVLAKGLLTLAAVIFQPYAWYLVVEKALQMIGWVA